VAYFVNNIADRLIDSDPMKNPCIVSSATEGWLLYAAAVTVAGIVAGFMLSAMAGLAVLTSMLTGWMYSYAGRLKQYPVLGTLVNVGIFTPLCLLCSDGSAAQPYTVSLMVVVSILVLQSQLLHEMMDAGDDRGRVLTTFLWCGRGPTLGVIVALGACLVGWVATHVQPTASGLLCIATFAATEVLAPLQVARHSQDAVAMRGVRIRIRTLGVLGGMLLYLHTIQTGGR
jgi:4-hydroxybenzoate polyprenyltransferase